MEEILRIADEVTIMRDGQYVGTWPAAELTTDLIISRMVGRDMTNRFPPKDYEPFPRETVLRVKDQMCIRDRANAGADKNGDGVIQYVMLQGEPGHQDAVLRSEYCLSLIHIPHP